MPRTPAPTAAPTTAALLALALGASPAQARDGRFLTELRWHPEPCRTGYTDAPERELAEDLVYLDSRAAKYAAPPAHFRWTARGGPYLCTDGASIPEPLQAFFGDPFHDSLVRAAVIHDWYCRTGERSFRETHLVFYDALVSDGVPQAQALLMYYAVIIAAPFLAIGKSYPPIGGHQRGIGARTFSIRGSVSFDLADTPQASSQGAQVFGGTEAPVAGWLDRLGPIGDGLAALPGRGAPDPSLFATLSAAASDGRRPEGPAVLVLADRLDQPEVQAAVESLAAEIAAAPDAFDLAVIERRALAFLGGDDRGSLLRAELLAAGGDFVVAHTEREREPDNL